MNEQFYFGLTHTVGIEGIHVLCFSMDIEDDLFRRKSKSLPISNLKCSRFISVSESIEETLRSCCNLRLKDVLLII